VLKIDRLIVSTLLAIAFLLPSLAAQTRETPPTEKADLLITNAKVYTVNTKQPWAEAVGIRGDRIIFVGTNRMAKNFQDSHTKVIDAGGKLVLPGMEDNHVHFTSGSRSLEKVDLVGGKTIEEMQRRIKAFAESHPDLKWIQGRGWMYATFPGNLPDKKLLDAVISDRPAIMTCADGHTTWVNSKALAVAGVTRDTKSPENGIIVHDANGEPTGALQEAASELVWKAVPDPTREETLAAYKQGLREMARVGVVRVHSLGGDFEHLDLLEQIRREGGLTARFSVAYFADPPGLDAKAWEALMHAREKYHDNWIEQGGVKTMLDGVIDSLTGAMIDPYAGQGSNRGKLFWSPADYNKTVAELDAKGIQVATHAIGDLAIRTALDGYENAARVNGNHDMRHKVEHIEDLAASDISRFAKLNVTASFQPLHANPEPNWMGSWIANVGPERETRAFAWNAVRQAGGRLAFGSDWPVVTIDPWKGIQLAVTRQDFDGQPPNGWHPELRVSLSDAVYACTLGGAYALHHEKDEGSIEPLKLADLIIISQNIFEVEPHKIAETKVITTIVGGKIVHDDQGAAAQPRTTAQ
jgi:predicted amidohydrolase YtcJ